MKKRRVETKTKGRKILKKKQRDLESLYLIPIPSEAKKKSDWVYSFGSILIRNKKKGSTLLPLNNSSRTKPLQTG